MRAKLVSFVFWFGIMVAGYTLIVGISAIDKHRPGETLDVAAWHPLIALFVVAATGVGWAACTLMAEDARRAEARSVEMKVTPEERDLIETIRKSP